MKCIERQLDNGERYIVSIFGRASTQTLQGPGVVYKNVDWTFDCYFDLRYHCCKQI